VNVTKLGVTNGGQKGVTYWGRAGVNSPDMSSLLARVWILYCTILQFG
jgi:hypothetical protein